MELTSGYDSELSKKIRKYFLNTILNMRREMRFYISCSDTSSVQFICFLSASNCSSDGAQPVSIHAYVRQLSIFTDSWYGIAWYGLIFFH